jgi:hypothetical protein
MPSSKTIAAGSLLLLASALFGAPLSPRIDLTVEGNTVHKALAVMANEVLNNQEEEYILLGTTDYFSGFNDGMTLAISDTTSFALTGNETLDLGDIGAELLQLEHAASALGTDYGTGQATAYAYAIVVLNTPFARTSGDTSALRATGVGPAAASPVKAAAAPKVQSSAAPMEFVPMQSFRREAYLR